MLLTTSDKKTTCAVVFGITFLIWSYWWAFWPTDPYHPFSHDILEYLPANQSAIQNSTLGFQKIFVLNLPSRHDQRESIIANTQNGTGHLILSWRDGVRGEDVTSLPKSWNASAHSMGLLGSYQAHMNILREVMERGVETALILEDDITWDPRLRDQLLEVSDALPSQQVTNVTNKVPFGTGWDVLWLGTCTNPPGPSDATIYFSEVTGTQTWVWDVNGGTACTFGYVVTRESAKRIMEETMQTIDDGYDHRLSDHCAEHLCPLVWPPLFVSKELGSDIVAEEVSRN